MFSFMKSFLGVKGKQASQEFVQAIVEMDPEGATLAQLDQMERDLDHAGMVLQKIRQDYDREVREAEAAETRFDQLMAAAEHLQARIAAASGADKTALENSLGRLVDEIERFAPELEQERQDVIDVKALLDEAQAAYRRKAEALANAKSNLERAKRDMQRAVMQQERAEEQARRAAEVAGLRSGPANRLGVAVDAMQRRADEARAKAATARMKAETLTSVAGGVPEGDPHIAEALKAAQHRSGGGDLTARLAALGAARKPALPPR